jgi:thioredoxin 1
MSVVEVDDSNFEAQVVQAGGPVLVDFSATWCGPCKKLEPVVHEVAGEYDGRLKVVKVDVDKAPGAAARFAVMAVPTLIWLRDGQVRDQVTGIVSKRTITEKVDKIL